MSEASDLVETAGEAADGQSAVRAIDELYAERVVLDVQVHGIMGTDVLRRLKRPPFVIFTPAYSEHTASAFELGAVDYLLKQFGPATARRRDRAWLRR